MGQNRTQASENISTDGKSRKMNKPIYKGSARGLWPLKMCAVIMMIAMVHPPARLVADADVQTGKALLEKRCGGCHALDADREGPRLKGVVGRPAGSIKTFQYSNSLVNAKLTWDEVSLDKWLTDPESVVPDNDMAFRLPKQEERAAIIAYLKSLSKR